MNSLKALRLDGFGILPSFGFRICLLVVRRALECNSDRTGQHLNREGRDVTDVKFQALTPATSIRTGRAMRGSRSAVKCKE